MIGLLQRVRRACVEIDGRRVAQIDRGLLVLIGIERGDDDRRAETLLDRLLNYRVFPDDAGRMNRSLRNLGADDAGLLLVPQFTLAADTSNGARPSFTSAAPPDVAREIYSRLVNAAVAAWPGACSGEFAADMQVSLINDGPVTFCLRS